MVAPNKRHLAATLVVLFSSAPLLAVSTDATAPAKEKGVLWEMTSQMSMEGMPMKMPVQKMKVCAPKNQAPVEADEQHKCTNTEFKTDGKTVSWKTVCAGSPAMTGEGVLTYSDADNYTGTIKFSSSEGSMTTKLTGKRIGDCDVPKK